jgi:hypothetical protein
MQMRIPTEDANKNPQSDLPARNPRSNLITGRREAPCIPREASSAPANISSGGNFIAVRWITKEFMELMSNKMRNLVNVRAWPVIKQWQISPEKVNEGRTFAPAAFFSL